LNKEKLRKCAGCGELKSRNGMIKITKEFLTGKVIVNPDSKTFGRSVYLCYNQNCIEQALKKNRLGKALKTNEDWKGLLDGQLKG
jgi:predicted RNA-binding protein YlxR (DUF448 family)